jgi:hypothetical protein
MKLSHLDLEDKSKTEILRELIEHVTKSDEEMDDKETRSGGQTDLNIYICDNQEYEIGDLNRWIAHIHDSTRVSGHAKNYAESHTFGEKVCDEDGKISLVTIKTPEKSREDEFIFVNNDGYLWVLTTIHHDWREKTIEKLLHYLPCVERLYLSSDNLEDLTRDIRDSRISGFIAKYHAPNREREATLEFHGAEPKDLEKVEDTFDAKPTRIEFNQKNSPDTAIQGATTNKARLTMSSVRDGSQNKAIETLLGLTEEYQELDRQSFFVEYSPSRERLEDGNGFAVDGFTAVELTDPDRKEADTLRDELEEEVLNKNKYRYGIRDSGRKIRVFDTEYDETFDIALEEPDIILYARKSTTALSLRDFVRKVYDELDSTYSLSKSENPVAVAE